MSPAGFGAELVLACQANPSLGITKNLKKALEHALKTSVQAYEFQYAALVLLRRGKPPVWYRAGKDTVCDSTCEIVSRPPYINFSDSADSRLLDSLNPVVHTTLPIILKADDPPYTLEIGILNTDQITAEYLLAKAVSLGRHIADIIKDSLVKTRKAGNFRKLAAWLEMVTTISSTLDIRQVLHVVTQLTADLFFARCCLYMLDENNKTIIPAVAVGSFDNQLKEKFKALKNCPPFPAITQAIKTRRPVIVTPADILKQLPPNIVEDFNYSWMVLAPIIKKDNVIGVMQVDRPYGFDSESAEIISAIARATAIAIENSRLVEMLERNEQRLHHLVEKIITAQEDERKRLASDLHDGIIQALIALWYRLQHISPDNGQDPGQWYREITDITCLLDEQIQDIRRILYDLRPIILDNYGLVPAIESYTLKIQNQSGIQISLKIQRTEARLPPRIEITLFRILQEAVTNIVKHSGATAATVELTIDEREIIMSVKDNGAGISQIDSYQGRDQARLGLASIQERAILLNGTCSIESRPGEGTCVMVGIPLDKQHMASDQA